MTHNTDKVAIHRSLQSRLNMTFSVAGLPIVHTVSDASGVIHYRY